MRYISHNSIFGAYKQADSHMLTHTHMHAHTHAQRERTYWTVGHWWTRIFVWILYGLRRGEPENPEHGMMLFLEVKSQVIKSFSMELITHIVNFHSLQITIQAFHNALPMGN